MRTSTALLVSVCAVLALGLLLATLPPLLDIMRTGSAESVLVAGALVLLVGTTTLLVGRAALTWTLAAALLLLPPDRRPQKLVALLRALAPRLARRVWAAGAAGAVISAAMIPAHAEAPRADAPQDAAPGSISAPSASAHLTFPLEQPHPAERQTPTDGEASPEEPSPETAPPLSWSAPSGEPAPPVTDSPQTSPAHLQSSTANPAPLVTVRPGDTLWGIAEQHLAHQDPDEAEITALWQRIYAENRSAIGADPHLIQPGLSLQIPSGSDDSSPAQENS